MNRRAFFGRFGAAATVAVAPNAMKAQHRRALQGGMPQCPDCLDVLPITVPRDDAARRAWAAQETHLVHCQRCDIDVVWRTLL